MPDPSIPPPPPARRDEVVDVVGGIEVPDPYRWLEDLDAPGARAWVDAQNERTTAVLDGRPDRPAWRDQLTRLLRAGSSTSCQVAGEVVFSVERWGDHDQAVLVARDAGTPGPGRTLVDPAARAGDLTAALDWYHASPDGRLVAYGLSTGGDERSTLHVLDVATGDDLPDVIPHTRAASVAWRRDGSGFAYTRYPDPDEVGPDDQGYWRRVFWHRLGDDWHDDAPAWDELPDKTAWPNVSISPDGRWMLVHVSLGWSRVDVHLVDLETGTARPVVEGIDAVSSFSVVGDQLIGLTTWEADRGRVVAVPLDDPDRSRWVTIIPEADHVIEAVAATSASLLVLSSTSAVSRLDRHALDGTPIGPVPLPALGSLAGLSASDDRDEAYFSFTSFTTPPTLLRWAAGEAPVAWSHLDAEDPDAGPTGDYVVEQVRYASADGTSVAMFLIRAAATSPDPTTPCVLTGYGGFAVPLGPAYSPAVVAVCDRGGLYAVANIRGGSEEGEAWHRAGMREHKQASFDDFIAAADWLVDQGRTSRPRLAIRGGSNGGLLMGAAITQRPDLCRAAQVAVPLLDMVRYHQFLIARLWIPEYGDPDVPDELAWLWAYSPYHRVVDGTCYPAVLLTAAEGDSRVDPLHARKMAARLQAATSCGDERPILLREESRAGHGQGKPVPKQAEELADVLSFLAWQLDWP